MDKIEDRINDIENEFKKILNSYKIETNKTLKTIETNVHDQNTTLKNIGTNMQIQELKLKSIECEFEKNFSKLKQSFEKELFDAITELKDILRCNNNIIDQEFKNINIDLENLKRDVENETTKQNIILKDLRQTNADLENLKMDCEDEIYKTDSIIDIVNDLKKIIEKTNKRIEIVMDEHQNNFCNAIISACVVFMFSFCIMLYFNPKF